MHCTVSPAFYCDYFRILHREASANKGVIRPEVGKLAMERYATIQVQPKHKKL